MKFYSDRRNKKVEKVFKESNNGEAQLDKYNIGLIKVSEKEVPIYHKKQLGLLAPSKIEPSEWRLNKKN